ncbi:MAG: hypothetical protein QHC88_12860 [Achromobacter sp.]|uniref:hypothetical protein n=1 Tax=Achromobacter sp. TaxID=134375 RepID=UPI0029AB6029|nr:hypothetical protein [Achromobacter sp.]MDX3986134.1 hypothetical protein [Achromobacter sp.]
MSTIKLPPLPTELESVYVAVDGLSTYREARDCYYTMDQMRTYAEEAVRQALAEAAAKLEVLAQEAFERPGVAGTVHMAYHQAIATILANPPEPPDG